MTTTSTPTTESVRIDARTTHRLSHRTPLRVAAALVALLTSLGLTVATPSTAQAHTWSSTGRPGQVQLKTVEVWAGEDFVPRVPRSSALCVRSPATTGAQDVFMFVSVDRWDDIDRRWVNESHTYWSVRIPARAQGAWLPATSVQPRRHGVYRVNTSFAWRVANTTTTLGTIATFANQSGDYWCSWPPYYCSITTAGGQAAAWVFP